MQTLFIIDDAIRKVKEIIFMHCHRHCTKICVLFLSSLWSVEFATFANVAAR